MIKGLPIKQAVLAIAAVTAAVLIGVVVYYGVTSIQGKQSVTEGKPPAVLRATYIKDAPAVDGNPDDPIWKNVPETILKIKGAPDLAMKAIYTDKNVYIRSSYRGKKEDAFHHLWEYDGKYWRELEPGDMIAYLFNMNNSLRDFNTEGWNVLTFKSTTEEEWPFEYCKDCHGIHGTPLRRKPKKSPWPFLKVDKPTDDSLKQRADLWEVSLGISCPTGKGFDWFLCPVPYMTKVPKDWSTYFIFQFMPDKFVYQRPFIVDTARRTDENKKIVDDYPVFMYKEGKNMDNTPFPTMDDMQPITDYSVFKKGDQIPHVVYEEGTKWGGSGDDLDNRAQWKDGIWTVDVGRKLNTGHPADDVIFAPKKTAKIKYYFAVWLRTRMIVDAGKAAAVSRPMVLEFEPKQ